MNASDILDYAVGRLEGRKLRRLRRVMYRDPTLGEKLRRLRDIVRTLLDDGGEVDYVRRSVARDDMGTARSIVPPEADPSGEPVPIPLVIRPD